MVFRRFFDREEFNGHFLNFEDLLLLLRTTSGDLFKLFKQKLMDLSATSHSGSSSDLASCAHSGGRDFDVLSPRSKCDPNYDASQPGS